MPCVVSALIDWLVVSVLDGDSAAEQVPESGCCWHVAHHQARPLCGRCLAPAAAGAMTCPGLQAAAGRFLMLVGSDCR